MTNYDPRIELQAHHICHMINQNEGIEIGSKSRHDVFFTTRAVAEYWKENSDKLRKDNHALRWNELSIYIKEHPDATLPHVLKLMEMLNHKISIRGLSLTEIEEYVIIQE